MKSAAAIPNPTGHPARFSGAVVDRLIKVLRERHVIQLDDPFVFDPFAGTGERLDEILQATGLDGGGIELEREFIVNRNLVKVGDATKARFYPDQRFVIVTSPVYPNGMAEAWEVSPADTSKRNTYTAAKGAPLKPNNMGALGYRGTKRGGTSLKRLTYWGLADHAVQCWADSEHCVGIYLNVSDFMSGGEVEPFVADWRDLLRRHGWTIVSTLRVSTPRHRGNDNADQRVGSESIIVAERA